MEPPTIDTTVPHSARVWNYWLGGKDNYPVDRAAGEQFREIFPEIVDAARTSRQFLDYIDADVREPDKTVLAAAKTLDFTRPTALMLLGILGHIGDHDEARSIVRRLLDALPSGSYMAFDDGTNVVNKAMVEEAQRIYNQSGAIPYHPRSPEQIAGFFEGLELLEPGVVSCPRWRPDPADAAGGLPAEVDMFGGVGRKP
jgi:O-methyltransferase involved in polyketide biosynthesis